MKNKSVETKYMEERQQLFNSLRNLDRRSFMKVSAAAAGAVLARGLDAQTAFEIVSIDIADIDVGENIGARLQADQAEADTRVAQATAEQRRAEAVAQEQAMKARIAENRAHVVLAEAEVPRAMANAFREGNFHAGPPGA